MEDGRRRLECRRCCGSRDAQSERDARIEVREADARSLPFPDRAFAVAHCSLLVHHLAPDEAVEVLREMRRVASLGVVVNDLRRGVFPLAATAISTVVAGTQPGHAGGRDQVCAARLHPG